MRALRHVLDVDSARRCFPSTTLDAIQRAIAASEARHRGEIVFAVEGHLPLSDIWRCRGARDRAHAAFAELRVWNTAHGTGVLVYVLLADRAIEIVADRGIAANVGESAWQDVCATMRQYFARREWRTGALAGVAAIDAILARHFPADGERSAGALPDRPVIL